MIVVDTGALVAAADADDRHHAACSHLLLTSRESLIVPAPVIVEVGYLLDREMGPRAEASFLRTLAAGGFPVEPTERVDLERAAELIERYEDLRLGGGRRSGRCCRRATGSDQDRHHRPSPLLRRTTGARRRVRAGAVTTRVCP